MGFPGYYLNDPSDVVEFPVDARWGSDDEGVRIERRHITHTTDGGRRWTYDQFQRAIFDCRFRVHTNDLQPFIDLDTLVNGDETAFYFLPDVDDISIAFYVKMTDANFSPAPMDTPGTQDGTTDSMWDVTLRMSEEPNGIEVQA